MSFLSQKCVYDKMYCSRVSSNLELGRNEDAIVDATLALRELHCILEGTEEHLWDVMDDRNDEDTLVS